MARTAAGSTTGGGAGPGWARVAKGEGAKGGKRNKRWFFCGVLGQPPQAGGAEPSAASGGKSEAEAQ